MSSSGVRWVLAAGLVAAGWLGGCAVDQAREVAQYQQEIDLTPQPIAFEPGNELSLSDAMLLANQHNETLAIEGENFLQALIDKQRAVAGFLPTVDFFANLTLRDPAEPGGRNDLSSSSIGATVPLFTGFRNLASLRRELATIEQRRALLLDAQETLLLDVAVVYYEILRAQRSVEVLRNSVEVQEERVRLAKGRLAAGEGLPLDVAQSEAQLASTRVTLLDAQLDVRNGRTVLAFITGAPVEQSVLSDQFLLPRSVMSLEVLIEMALERRDDLQAADAAARAARQNVEVAFGQYYPTIALDLDALLHSNPSVATDWAATLRLNAPIFSAGLIEADVRSAWSAFRQSVLAYDLLRRQIVQEVTIAHENAITSRARLLELETQLRAAEAAFRQAEGLYQTGRAINLDRIAAQDDFLNAQLQLVSEQYNQKILYLNLLRAAGQMRENDELLPAVSDEPLDTFDPAEDEKVEQTPEVAPAE